MPDSKTKLVILGAGTLASEVLDAVHLAGRHEMVGFVVNDGSVAAQREYCGLPVVDIARMEWAPGEVEIIGAIANPRRHVFIGEVRDRGFAFATVIHPAAILSRSVTIAPGCFIGAGAIVAARVTLRDHVIVNRGANIGPDTDVGPCSTIGPGAVIAGAVSIGAGAYLGIGAVIRDHVTIGHAAIVAAGAVVVKPVPERTLVTGSPARSVR